MIFTFYDEFIFLVASSRFSLCFPPVPGILLFLLSPLTVKLVMDKVRVKTIILSCLFFSASWLYKNYIVLIALFPYLNPETIPVHYQLLL